MEEKKIEESRRELKELENKLKSLREGLNKKLELEKTEVQDIKVGIRKNGRKYSVRDNRDRSFFPDEWMKFYDNLKQSQKMTFDMLVQTGGRINELINIKVGDIDFKRNNIILRVTKVKARKGEKNPRPRTISISSQFSRRLKSYLKEKNKLNNNNEKIGLLSKPATHIALKNSLQKSKINDWMMFSTHNIRKTHGNWLKALGKDALEICTRLGHDYNTFIKSYGSPDIYSFKDKGNMRMILGDLV